MNTKSLCLFLAVAGALTGAAADELVVSSDMTLSADTTCSSIRFTGGYSLSAADGVKVTVEAGGGITVASGAATVNCLVQFGSTTDGATIDASEAPIVVPSGATLTFSSTACLSGDAKIVIDQPGTVNMYATNTFNGTCYIKNGFFNVYSDGAFGTTKGGTTYDCTGRSKGKVCMKFYGVTIKDAFKYTAGGVDIDATATFYPGSTGTNSFAGMFTAPDSNFRWTIAADTTVSFDGLDHTNDFKGACLIFSFSNASTGRLVFNSPSWFGHWYTGSGQVYFNEPVAVSPYRGLYSYLNTFHMGMENVFHKLPHLSFSNTKGTFLDVTADGMTFDLHGYDQMLYFIKESYTTYKKSDIRSEKAATLRLLGVNPLTAWEKGGLTATTYSGKFTGAVSLQVEGGDTAAKTKPLTLNGESTSTGLLCVTNGGLLTLSSTACWAGDVRVAGSGSKLTVENLNAFSETVKASVFDSGELCLSTAGEHIFGDLKINGTSLAEGTYAAGADAFEGLVTGSGSVRVQKTVVTPVAWTWNDADDDRDLYEEDNWEETGKPDFTDSSVQARFATAGTTAVFGGTPLFRKITFDTSGFTLATNAANSYLTLYGDGIVAPEASAERTFTLTSPVKLAKPQTWNVGTKCTLQVAGPLTAGDFVALAKQGAGTVTFTKPGEWEGTVNHQAGMINIVGGSIGGSKSKLNVSSAATVQFTGGTFAHDIWLECMSGTASCQSGTTNTFSGSIDLNGQNVRCHLYGGSQAIVKKPILRAGYQTYVYPYDGAELTLEEGCLLGNFCVEAKNTGTNVVRFAGTGFTLGGNYNYFRNNLCVTFDVDRAINLTNRVWKPVNLYRQAVIDLNGHDQGFGGLNSRQTSNASGAITSAKPATLYDCQMYGNSTSSDKATSTTSDPAFVTKFTGAVSFSKSGSAYFYLGGVSTTSGRLEVTEGTLGFKESGSWLNASEIDVLGGTLVVDQVGRLPKKVQTIKIGKSATLSLATGVSIRCRELYVQNSDDSWTKTTGSFKTGDLGGRVTGGGTLTATAGVAVILR